jgi:alkaline phosphatase D
MRALEKTIVLALGVASMLWSPHAAGQDAATPADKKAQRAAKKEARANPGAPPATRPAKPRSQYGYVENHAGTLENCLTELGQFKQPPQQVIALFEAAYKALATRRDATFMDVSADPDVQRICKENGIDLLGGPLLGSVREDSASVWVRTVRPAQVEVRVTTDAGEKKFGPVASSAGTDLTAVVKVTGLSPSATYRYRVLVDGRPAAIPDGATITTAPKADAPGKVRIAFGSCFHRWGLGNHHQAERILSRKPAALVAIGDIAVQDRDNNLGMHRADYLLRDCRPAWKALAASLPVYAAWDDHDYFNNDKWGIPRGYTDQDRRDVRDVFVKSWANPMYGFGDEGGGAFCRARIGPCDVIMVDHRYFRTGDKTEGSLLGPEQMKWLEQQLLSCTGPFTILSCGTMWSDYITPGKDSWGVHDPQGRERLFRFIEKNRIGGVLLISGDRHGARGFTIPRPSGFKFYEFEAASLGGRSGPPIRARDTENQFYGIAGRYAFGEFMIDATAADPTVEFRLIGDDGAIIHEMKLTRSQLTPGGPE